MTNTSKNVNRIVSFIDLFQYRRAEDLYDDVGAEEINLDDDAYDEANTISK